MVGRDSEYYEEDKTYEEDLDHSLDYDEPMKSSENVENLNSVDRIFNTEALLHHIKMSMLGYVIQGNRYFNTGEAVARTVVVNKMINSLRSIINTENMLSYKNDQEINIILLEKAKEHIYSLFDDETTAEENIEHIVNMLDHPAEMFMGIVKSGDGSEAARQILTGNYLRLNDKQEDSAPLARIGTKDYDLFTFGRKR